MSSIDISAIFEKQKNAIYVQRLQLQQMKNAKEEYQDEIKNIERIMYLSPGERTQMDEYLLQRFIQNLQF